MATRMAYNLGLHVDPSKWVESGHLTEEDASIRSIAWWGCYMVEKYFERVYTGLAAETNAVQVIQPRGGPAKYDI